MAKTRLSTQIDAANVGIKTETNFKITNKGSMLLKKSIRKALKKTGKGSIKIFESVSKSDSSPNSVSFIYTILYPKLNGDTTSIQYELKQSGNNYFINCKANPVTLLSGDNVIPVIVAGVTPLENFGEMLRLPYNVLEDWLPDFKWCSKDRKNIDEGNIHISFCNMPFYSGDLGEHKDTALQYIRTLYSGFATSDLGKVSDTLIGAGELLGIQCIQWPGTLNTTLKVTHGSSNKSYFSLTCYDKNVQNEDSTVTLNKKMKDDRDMVKSRIRYDVSMYSKFMRVNNMETIAKFESLYEKVCEVGGYDIGFTRWLSDKIMKKIQLPYLLTMNKDSFYERVRKAESKYVGESTAAALVFQEWCKGSKCTTAKEYETKLGVKKVYKARTTILDTFGIDVFISKQFINSSILALTLACMTKEEQETLAEMFTDVDGMSNAAGRISFPKISKRLTKVMKQVASVMLDENKTTAITKFKPNKIVWKKAHFKRVSEGKISFSEKGLNRTLNKLGIS